MTRREIEKELQPKLSNRDIKIILDYSLGVSKSAIARDLNLTRERVRQIVERIAGVNDPDIVAGVSEYEFDILKDLVIVLDIPREDIARDLGIQRATVNKYFSKNGAQYLNDRTRAKYFAIILRLVRKKLDTIEDILDKLIAENA